MYELLGAYSQQISPEYPVDFAVIEPLLQLKDVEKGAYLFHEGSICDAVGLTQKGCLRSFFLKEGKELTLFFHQEQQTLGDYESLKRQKPACFSCQAVEDSTVLLINSQAIEEIGRLPNGQRLLRLVIEELAFQLRDRLLSLYRDTSEQRYLNLIDHQPQLLRRIPQYYVASYLGIEPESLSRLKRRVHKRRFS